MSTGDATQLPTSWVTIPLTATSARPVVASAESSTGNEDDHRFARALRWYSSAWRERNAAVVIGILRDQADERGAVEPAFADRVALAVGGLRERFLSPEPFPRLAMVSFGLLALLSFWYFATTWAPGISYPGTFGPFANPSVIAGFVFVAAFALAIARRALVARLFVLVGIAVEISVGIVSNSQLWLGPSWTAVALFVGLALIAAFPPRGFWPTFASAVALVIFVVVLTFVLNTWSYAALFSPIIVVGILAVAVALVGGSLTVAVRLRRIGGQSARRL